MSVRRWPFEQVYYAGRLLPVALKITIQSLTLSHSLIYHHIVTLFTMNILLFCYCSCLIIMLSCYCPCLFILLSYYCPCLIILLSCYCPCLIILLSCYCPCLFILLSCYWPCLFILVIMCDPFAWK
jgi:hypothetical protein